MKISPFGLNSKTAKTSLRWLPEPEPELQNSKYAGHQVGPKNSESQNFSFLGLMVLAVGLAQILRSRFRTFYT
jgi:hypothetical protein